jgi:ketosteroid isomerase-like protein
MHRQLLALRDTFMLGMLVGDAELCASVYDPNACLVPPDEQLRNGPDEILGYWQHVIDTGGRGDSVTCRSVEVRGGLLVERGVYARYRDPVALGPPVARGSYAVVAERQLDGSLAWVADSWTDRPAFPEKVAP